MSHSIEPRELAVIRAETKSGIVNLFLVPRDFATKALVQLLWKRKKPLVLIVESGHCTVESDVYESLVKEAGITFEESLLAEREVSLLTVESKETRLEVTSYSHEDI